MNRSQNKTLSEKSKTQTASKWQMSFVEDLVASSASIPFSRCNFVQVSTATWAACVLWKRPSLPSSCRWRTWPGPRLMDIIPPWLVMRSRMVAWTIWGHENGEVCWSFWGRSFLPQSTDWLPLSPDVDRRHLVWEEKMALEETNTRDKRS